MDHSHIHLAVPFYSSLQKAPVHYPWMVDHDANPSATKKAYVPYSTTKPKVESWVPGGK